MKHEMKILIPIITIIIIIIIATASIGYVFIKHRAPPRGYFIATANYNNDVSFDLNELSIFFSEKNITTRYMGSDDIFLTVSPNDITNVTQYVEISICQIVEVDGDVKISPQICCTIVNENGYQVMGTEEELRDVQAPALQTSIDAVVSWVYDCSGIAPMYTEVYFHSESYL